MVSSGSDGRYWCFGLAFVSLLIASSDSAHSQDKSGTTNATADKQAQVANPEPPPDASAKAISEAAIKIERALGDKITENGQTQSQRDLNAQENMALWALIMALATIITTGVSIYVAIIVKRTLAATADAASHAKTMADEASKATAAAIAASDAGREANDIARGSSERQLRAYLSFRDIEVTNFKRGARPVFKTRLWNSGQTPAYEVIQWQSAWPCEGDPNNFKVHFPTGIVSVSVIAPGQDVNSPIRGNNNVAQRDIDEMIDWVIEGKRTMVFAGIMSYRDAFGKRRLSTFKNFLTLDELDESGNARLSSCVKGNMEN